MNEYLGTRESSPNFNPIQLAKVVAKLSATETNCSQNQLINLALNLKECREQVVKEHIKLGFFSLPATVASIFTTQPLG